MALLASLAFAALFGAPVEAGLYPKSSAVLSITGKSYDRLIAQSNHTSIVEFYAPWCGHCKNLQPAYEKAAKSLSGLAKVAAIDCDDEANKPFCGSMGVQGFPTLKIVKPSRKPGGKPIVEDYQGARTAKAIVDAVVERIPNHVKRVGDKDVEGWLGESVGKARAILFTDKGTVSSLMKALSVDFLGSVAVAQVRDKEAETVRKFGIKKFPMFVVVPAGEETPIVYAGEMKKDAMLKFITGSTGVAPNPDPAPESAKKTTSKKPKKDEKKSQKKFEQSSKSHKSADASSEKLKATSIKLEEDNEATPSPDPQVDTPKPVKVPVGNQVAVLDVMEEPEHLAAKCLNPSAKICILILLPSDAGAAAPGTEKFTPDSPAQALLSLSEVRHKLSGRGTFPFYAVAAENPLGKEVRDALDLAEGKVAILATSAKRGWVRRFKGSLYGVKEVGEWVDSIKMNEGVSEREALPESLVKQIEEPKKEEPVVVEEPKKDEGPNIVLGEEKVEEIKLNAGKWGEKMIYEQDGMHFEVEELEEDFEMPEVQQQQPRDEL